MKKVGKNLMILFVALVSIFGISMSYVNAVEGPIIITITGASSVHTYEAYQIFKGDATSTKNQLVDITWGDGVDSDGIIADLKAANNLCKKDGEPCEEAQDVADWLDRNENSIGELDDEIAKKFAAIVGKNLLETKKSSSSYEEASTLHKITVSAEGYYFIKDSTLTDEDDEIYEDESYTRYILRVLGGNNENNIAVKADLPTFTANVLDATSTAQTFVIKEIGATVTYQITIAMPKETFNEFAAYKLIVHDLMSSGVTYNTGSLKVELVNAEQANQDITNKFTYGQGTGTEITFTAENLKTITGLTKNSKIVLTYTANVNDRALANETGNQSTAYLEFSNDPNDGTGATLGKTSGVTTTVYTYELDIVKRDGRHTTTTLPNAVFLLCEDSGKAKCAKLTKKDNEDFYTLDGWVASGSTSVKTDNAGLVKIRGLEDKDYYLFEETAPAGYNRLLGATTVEMDTATNSVLTLYVDNYKGSLLPSTGGIGTTIFYVCGISLICGAIIFIIIGKKKNQEEE